MVVVNVSGSAYSTFKTTQIKLNIKYHYQSHLSYKYKVYKHKAHIHMPGKAYHIAKHDPD